MGLAGWMKRLVRGDEGAAAPGGGALSTEAMARVEGLRQRGIQALDEGDALAARVAFRTAVDLDPMSAAHRVNLAFALQQTDADEAAVEHLRRAIELDATSFDARYMLAGALERREAFADAAEQLRVALTLQPGFEQAHVDLCRVLARANLPDPARTAVRESLQRFPNNADLHSYSGNLLLADRDVDAAIKAYGVALALNPQRAEYLANLGAALAAAGRLDEALERLQQAVRVEPDVADYHGRLGQLLFERGRLEDAIPEFERALHIDPGLSGVYVYLGLALLNCGKAIAAREVLRRGLEIKPTAAIHEKLGLVLHRLAAPDEALECYEAAIEMDKASYDARVNLAGLISETKGPQAGAQAYYDVVERFPYSWPAHQNLLLNLCVAPGVTPQDYLAEAARLDAKMVQAAMMVVRAPRRPGPLRVGFVSADLRQHPVGLFLEGVLEHLDRTSFELYAYHCAPVDDALSDRIRPRFARWRNINRLEDGPAAEVIRDDGIDILVDLAGHTGGSRLSMFARRPASLQISWLGYYASTGMSFIDYMLVDPECVPPGHEYQFSEKLWRVPHTRLCYTPPPDDRAPPVSPLPALTHGHLTFGSFQRIAKFTDETLQTWKRVLEALPTSRLLLQNPYSGRAKMQAQLLGVFEAAGIGRERITMRPPGAHIEYLRAHADVDMILDTFPFPGGTTTCEALWMGVPSITLDGGTMISSQGAALMRVAGLPGWVARDTDDYVRLALAAAADLPALAAQRMSMRDRVRTSPLFDVKSFARDFEVALTGMWADHLANQALTQNVADGSHKDPMR